MKPQILIDKLALYGFEETSLKWVKSYLTGRTQAVKIDGCVSGQVELTLGTPQGSRISPLLFSIIMADLDLWVEKSFLSNYADDTQTCVIADSPDELRTIVEQESRAVLNFFSSINLCNNTDKAALIINSRGHAGQMTVNDIGGKSVTSKERQSKPLGPLEKWIFEMSKDVAKL